MRKAVSAIFLVILLASCANDGRVEPTESVEAPVKVERTDQLPFACDLFTQQEMLKILDKQVDMEVLVVT